MTRRCHVGVVVVAAAIGFTSAGLTLPSANADPASQQVRVTNQAGFTFVVGSVLSAPHGVTGADGRQHLAHEVQLLNTAPLPIALKRLDTIDPATGAVLESLRGPALTARTERPEGLPYQGVIPAGRSVYVILDATLPRHSPLPTALTHRIMVDFPPLPPGFPPVAKDYRIAPTPVRQDRPVLLEPPLRGPRWVAVNGCCDALNAHRGGILPVNGRVLASERFAIDFVQLDRQQRLFSGPIGRLAGYPGYGKPVLAVGAGRIVAVHVGEPDQIPGNPPPPLTLQTAGGNWVVLDLGAGHLAYYAHLKPGSVRVRVGEAVHPGQVLGLVGNSGNTTAPHLHFQIISGLPFPLTTSLPYEFRSFESAGTVADERPLDEGRPVRIIPRLAGAHRAELPLNLEVVRFG